MYTLVPVNFFNPGTAREALSGVARISEDARVEYLDIPAWGAVLVYEVSGEDGTPPDIYGMLCSLLDSCHEYNKLLCSWKDGSLDIVVAQGRSLLLANSYKAPDFTTALYYILLAMKSLQLNPEVTTACFTHALPHEEQMMLYRYFKSVETA